jgi:hypothetical protein
MVCIFCGGGGKASSEHVIPLWMDPFLSQLPTTGTKPGGKRMTHRFTPGPGGSTPTREWHNDGPDLKTNAVCERCNNGWLSDLEASACELAGPLVIGEPALLATGDQRVLATWCYKTALLMQMLRPKASHVIPPARFTELCDLGRPPTDARVWLASRQGGNAMHEGLNEINIAGSRLKIPGFFSLLALGRLVILVAGRLTPGPERIRIGSDVDPRITVQIWPTSCRPSKWPPLEPLDDLAARSVIAKL